MRCSVCLGEIKEGPNGLYCESCDCILEPVSDGEQAVPVNIKPRFDKKQIGFLAAGAIGVALLGGMLIALLPGQTGAQNLWGGGSASSLGQAFIESDPNQVVADIMRVSMPDDRIQLIKDKGCQRVEERDLDTIHWINMTGESLSLITPETPGNWRMGQVCPTDANGLYLLSHLNESVAISEIASTGDLKWTQMLNANDNTGEAIAFSAFGDEVMVASQQAQDSRVQIASFGPGGIENWKQTIIAASDIARPTIVRNSFEDYLVAWQEAEGTVRLLIISVTGIVVQDFRIQGHGASLRGVVDDDLGRTLLLGGDDYAYAELVSATGDIQWRRTISTAAEPIGVARTRDHFLIFAAAENAFYAWGLDENGTRSNTIELETSEPVSTGSVRQINATEAIVTLQSEAGPPVAFIINLRRLSNGLAFDDTSDLAAAFPIAPRDTPEPTPPPAIDSGPQLDPASTAAAAIEAIEPVSTESDLPESDIQETSQPNVRDAIEDRVQPVEIEPVVPEPTVIESDVDTEPEPQPAPRVTSETPVDITVSENNAQARCTFTCVSLDEPIVEYVLMQTVDVAAGESLTDVELRLNKNHETLCSVSSGQPDETFSRECTLP